MSSTTVPSQQDDRRRAAKRSCTRVVALLAFVVAPMSVSHFALAQDYPVKPVRIVVGQSAGSAADAVARLIADSLSGVWQQPVNVENKGGAAGTIAADLLAGRVDMGLYDFSAVEQHVSAGALRMLAAIGATRATSAPDVATVAEQGVPGYAIEAWYGLLAPAGTPPDVVARISGAIDEIRRTAAFRRRLADLSYEPVIDTPAQFAAVIRSDIARYAEIIKRAGIDARRNLRGATQ